MSIEPVGAVPVVAPVPAPVLPTHVHDVGGSDVTVTDVDRIVTLWGGISEAVVALGLGDRIVGRDASTTLAELDEVPFVTRSH